MTLTGNDLLAEALVRQGTEKLFFLMGAPLLEASTACAAAGIRMIDVRHEQAAAMMAHASARVLARPGVCLAAAGPGIMNLASGLANALIDGAPVAALGSASPIGEWDTGAFQDIDQLAIMRPVTKWAARVHEARRIPEYVHRAFAEALSGKPGPVYLDLPGDVLYQTVEDAAVVRPPRLTADAVVGPAASAEAVAQLLELLRCATRPIVLAGSGVLWSHAAPQLRQFVAASGVPCCTTPQARGAVAEDGPAMFPGARSFAFHEADLVLVVGTRLNYVVGFGRPPRFSAAAMFVRIDIDLQAIACDGRAALGIAGDAGSVLDQLLEVTPDQLNPDRYATWRDRLAVAEAEHRRMQTAWLGSDQVPIHPLRLCREIGAFMRRDAILIADGQEILHYEPSLIGVVGVKLRFLSHRCVVSIVGSITPVAARRFDVGKGREVDIDDGFERVCCRAVLEAVWEYCEPVGVLSLQCEQYADGVTPTLRAATSIGRTAWSGDARAHFRLVAGAITGLAFGVAQCVVPRWFAASRHGCVLRYCNSLQWDRRQPGPTFPDAPSA